MIEIEKQRMQELFNTAREGAINLEEGDTEPAWEALNSLADSLFLVALQNDVMLEIPKDEEEDA